MVDAPRQTRNEPVNSRSTPGAVHYEAEYIPATCRDLLVPWLSRDARCLVPNRPNAARVAAFQVLETGHNRSCPPSLLRSRRPGLTPHGVPTGNALLSPPHPDLAEAHPR